MVSPRSRLAAILALGLALLPLVLPAPGVAAAGPSPSAYADHDCVAFQPRPIALCGRFLVVWREQGGLAQHGYPLANAFTEVNPADGAPYLVQYFERARFEYHPENATSDDVQLGLLGREQFQARYPDGSPGGDRAFADAECAWYPQTGKQICGPFLAYWREHGGLARQGLPLTGHFLERNPADGETYAVQYFERARFEYHPGQAGLPGAVLLGLLGSEQFLARYPDGTFPGSPPPSPNGNSTSSNQ